MNRVIEIVVSPQGQAKLQTRGFTGADCQEASRFLVAALGQVTSQHKTAEHYLPAAANKHLRQDAG